MVENQPLMPTPEVTPDVTPYVKWTWTNEAADAFGHTLNIREKEILHGPGARRGRRIASVVSDKISDAVLIAKAPEMLAALKDIERNMIEDLNSIVDYLATKDIEQAKSCALQSQVALAKRTRTLLREIERDRP